MNFLSTGDGPSWPAGWLYVTQPALILTTAAIALLGLVGLAMGSLKHRGFLQLSLVVGLLLVTLGHVSSPLSPQLQDLLDGPLAALRNTHKFELVVRLPLMLAAAHALTRLTSWATARGVHRRIVPVLAACLVVSVATPAIFAQLPRPEGYEAIPAHWREAATWLDSQQTSRQRARRTGCVVRGLHVGLDEGRALPGLAETPDGRAGRSTAGLCRYYAVAGRGGTPSGLRGRRQDPAAGSRSGQASGTSWSGTTCGTTPR